MVLSNQEVFSGKKTIEQARNVVKELKESYSDFGTRWVEPSREEDKYLLWARARYDKVESEVAKYPVDVPMNDRPA